MAVGNDNIVELGAHERMKPSEALDLTKRENPPEVMIIFTDHEGELGIRTSHMSNKDALWNLECAKALILKGAMDDD